MEWWVWLIIAGALVLVILAFSGNTTVKKVIRAKKETPPPAPEDPTEEERIRSRIREEQRIAAYYQGLLSPEPTDVKGLGERLRTLRLQGKLLSQQYENKELEKKILAATEAAEKSNEGWEQKINEGKP
ncbi:MAG: hypothetical protein PHW72_00520 [Candidatus Pacebacteria bacterium]|nr:hypothetical protein [Candidatus Paceibacterota bacterium]